MHISIEFSSDVAYLKVLRAMVHEICAPKTTDLAEIHWMVQAVDEAVANAMQHAYAGQRGNKITVSCALDGHDVEFRVSDTGARFDYPASAHFDPKTYLDAGEPGGMGLHIIRRVADRVEYRSERGVNTLYIHRRLRGTRSAAAPPAA